MENKKGAINWVVTIIILLIAFVVLAFVVFPTLQKLFTISKEATKIPEEKTMIEIQTEDRMAKIFDFVSAKIEVGVESKNNLCKINLVGIPELEKGWKLSLSQGTNKAVMQLINDKGQIVEVKSFDKLRPCYVGNDQALMNFNINWPETGKICPDNVPTFRCLQDYTIVNELSINGEKAKIEGKEIGIFPILYKSFDSQICFITSENPSFISSEKIQKIKECE